MKQMRLRDEGPHPVSMVLLLRRPTNLTLEYLRIVAQRAWDVSFSDAAECRNFVSASGDGALVSAGAHLISLLACPRQYFSESSGEISGNLLQSSQEKAWAEHSAWISLDYLQGGANRALEYGVLARLAAEMVTYNCCGVYVPGERAFAPNDGSLHISLRRIAASRDSGI